MALATTKPQFGAINVQMASKNNVNPDPYKTAGRDPQGQAVLQTVEKQQFKEEKARLSRAADTVTRSRRRKEASETPAASKPVDEDRHAANRKQ